MAPLQLAEELLDSGIGKEYFEEDSIEREKAGSLEAGREVDLEDSLEMMKMESLNATAYFGRASTEQHQPADEYSFSRDYA